MTKETINNLYIYLVLFVTLIISIFGLARVIDTSLALVVDTTYRTPYSEYVMQLRNECSSYGNKTPNGELAQPYARLTKAECKELETTSDTKAASRLFAEQEQTAKENDQRNKLSQLLRSIPWFLVPLPFFFMFNKMRKEQK